jgi:N-acetylglutamate synthase-like GNAT family acetyltransferase
LDIEQSIFTSLRSDYPEFLEWMNKVRADSDARQCFVVTEADGTYAAIAILKLDEKDCPHELVAPVMKISTFKVDQPYAGSRYGELLLKAVLQSHADHQVASAYVEVLTKYDRLIDFMAQFGYDDTNVKTRRGEVVLAKRYTPRDNELPALEYHRRYGPAAVSPSASVFIVPIQPRWHDQLFPECRPASDLGDQLAFPEFGQAKTLPWGNALRKAYLCNSATNTIKSGDALLFYRSGQGNVAVVGVVESTLRSSSPDELMNQVGGRTVYTRSDVEAMASHQSQVLSILFRRDRLIEPQWSYHELIANNVLRAPPRTVMKVKEAGTTWVHQQLADMR